MLRCPRCSRVNPTEALFCYHDGSPLGDPTRRRGVADPARQRFLAPFVFPSGLTCNTFDELALGIQSHWDEARDLLAQGVLGSFLGSLGRGDLALAARESARSADLDRGLDALLRRLPSGMVEAARLIVEPMQLNCGTVRPGGDLRVELHLRNQGMGLLTGNVTCDDSAWLALGDGSTRTRRKLLQFRHEATVSAVIRGKALRASRKPYTSRILIETSGGTFQVPVCLEVPVLPFPEGTLAGATSPREIAEKAVTTPKEAAALFASGAVARWYQANGWSYPVQDPAASGVAGVQQFFEALGLTTPPKVAIGASEVLLTGRAGSTAEGELQVYSLEKKPVYAHASSDQPWLEVAEVVHSGRNAAIRLQVKAVPDRPGETLRAQLTVRANGGQQFVVPVQLAVRKGAVVAAGVAAATAEIYGVQPLPGERSTPPPRRGEVVEDALPVVDHPEALPAALPAARAEAPAAEVLAALPAGSDEVWRYVLAALPVLFLLMGLSITLVRDLAARAPRGAASGPESFEHLPQMLSLNFHDTEEEVRLSSGGSVKPTDERNDRDSLVGRWEPSMRFGLVLRDDGRKGGDKRLTYDRRGETNNAVVRLDQNEWLFGDRPFRLLDGRTMGTWPGRWLQREAPLARPMREGRRSVWVYDAQRVEVAQTVGLIPGAQSDQIDTCLVHYRIDNRDTRPHFVGLRFLLDTFIGGNDGVPFLIPGEQQLCVTSKVFNGAAAVPDFIQARETEDLASPGTVASIQLKIPGLEPPSRVTLGAWPNPALGERCRQEKTLWDVPVYPIKTLTPADSAVVIYWHDRWVPAGGSREVAFAYGLGSVAAGDTGGQLGLSVAGSFAPSGEFTLTAEVNGPVAGQTLTLEPPAEFTLIAGKATEPVPPLPPGSVSRVSPVTWKLRAAPRPGTYSLRVRSSTGAAQVLPLRIQVRGIFGN